MLKLMRVELSITPDHVLEGEKRNVLRNQAACGIRVSRHDELSGHYDHSLFLPHGDTFVQAPVAIRDTMPSGNVT
jgi:hypothetical protein